LGLERLRLFLARHRRIALDTSVFFYQVEANPQYIKFTDHIFHWVAQSGNQALTSTITLTELVVQPYRQVDEQRVNEFYGLLSTYPNLEWIPPNLEIADLAARIRALHRLRTPDALQAATAMRGLAAGLITNDSVFERLKSLEVLVLDKI